MGVSNHALTQIFFSVTERGSKTTNRFCTQHYKRKKKELKIKEATEKKRLNFSNKCEFTTKTNIRRGPFATSMKRKLAAKMYYNLRKGDKWFFVYHKIFQYGFQINTTKLISKNISEN